MTTAKRCAVTFLLAILALLPGLHQMALAQDNPVRSIPIPASRQFRFKLSPDGKLAAIFFEYNIESGVPDPLNVPIRVIDLSSGTMTASFTGAVDYADDVAFSPDSKQVASYHLNGMLYLWDAATGKLIKQFQAFFAGGRITFLPNGKTLVVHAQALGISRSFLLWDMESGAISRVIAYQYPNYATWLRNNKTLDSFYTFYVSPDGSQLVTISMTGSIYHFDIASGKVTPLREIPPDIKNTLVDWLGGFTPDGKSVIYFDLNDTMVHILDVSTAKERDTIPITSRFFAVSSDTLAWIDRAQKPAVLQLTSLSAPHNTTTVQLPLPEDTIGQPVLRFTADGRQLVIGGFAAIKTANNMLDIVSLSGQK